MGALNIPSAADIERLTRRLRSVSHRLEGIEDGVHRLDRSMFPSGVEARLSAIEDQLGSLTRKLSGQTPEPPAARAAAAARSKAAGKTKAAGKAKPAVKLKAAKAKASGKAKTTGKAKTSGKAKPKAKAKKR